MKTLKQLLEKSAEKPTPTNPIEKDSITSLVPRTNDERRFYDKHTVKKTDDRNGNGDDVFNASNIKTYDRSASNHGYNSKQDQEVYETTSGKLLKQILGEKTLTPNEMKKREEIAQAIERDNPDMPMGKKMAIATSKAKQVAEETDMFDCFAESVRDQVKEVYDILTEENKQIFIELVEAEEYDAVVDIVKEVLNG